MVYHEATVRKRPNDLAPYTVTSLVSSSSASSSATTSSSTATPFTLSGLASVGSATLNLVSAHAGAQLDIDTGWRVEAKALGYLGKVELVDVEDTAQAVAGVGVDISFETVLGRFLHPIC